MNKPRKTHLQASILENPTPKISEAVKCIKKEVLKGSNEFKASIVRISLQFRYVS